MDEKYMRFAIQLAENMKGQTAPNPPVGAVVVKNGAIIGFGAHLQAGTSHAEAMALEMAGDRAEGAHLYVTLEPCSHQGRMPPCADLIIQKGIQKVFVACMDVHEKVNGNGLRKLQAAGIDVITDFLYDEAISLYEAFFHFVRLKRPFITVKTAVSLDGKIATSTGESKWITDQDARKDAHLYRHTHDGILAGVNTVIHDDPQLTARMANGRNPIRMILDTHLRTPLHAKVITDGAAETWLFVGSHVTEEQQKAYLQYPAVRIFPMKRANIDVRDVLQVLYDEAIMTVLIEGGGIVNDAFLQEKYIDQLIIYQAPIVIGGEHARSAFAGKGIEQLNQALQFNIGKTEQIGKQLKIIAKRKGAADVYRHY